MSEKRIRIEIKFDDERITQASFINVIEALKGVESARVLPDFHYGGTPDQESEKPQ